MFFFKLCQLSLLSTMLCLVIASPVSILDSQEQSTDIAVTLPLIPRSTKDSYSHLDRRAIIGDTDWYHTAGDVVGIIEDLQTIVAPLFMRLWRDTLREMNKLSASNPSTGLVRVKLGDYIHVDFQSVFRQPNGDIIWGQPGSQGDLALPWDFMVALAQSYQALSMRPRTAGFWSSAYTNTRTGQVIRVTLGAGAAVAAGIMGTHFD